MIANRIIKTYPLTLITISLIWYLSFFSPPSTKLDHVFCIDKIVHFGMYAFLTAVLLLERNHGNTESRNYGDRGQVKSQELRVKGGEPLTMGYIFLTLISPILMSGLIEILQETCTGGRRSGDVWDFVANSLGVITVWMLWRRVRN